MTRPEGIDDLLEYIAGSPSPYHAVARSAARLESAGFSRLEEENPWSAVPGDRRYVVRGGSIVAFVMGATSPAEAGFNVVGAHTDSPNLRVKPLPDRKQSGYCQVGVEVYGGVLLATWLDRDLGLSGRIVVDGDAGPVQHLVLVDRPIARIPMLAIHLHRTVNDDGVKLNKEQHLRPILGLEGGATFSEWLARECGVAEGSILGHDLMFHDLTPPCTSGIDDEFIHAPRLDNLAMCHAGLEALIAGADKPVAPTRVVALYDHEEVGSSTAEGAAGSFFEDVFDRLVAVSGDGPDDRQRARSRSFLVSADMAHAVHPNWPEKHETAHMPAINGGPVIKINANARYATNAPTTARFAELCRAADVPVQRFVMRADMACGSTIGPIVSTRMGIDTVDIGNPMLSMHSCREMAGSRDHGLLVKVMTRFFSPS